MERRNFPAYILATVTLLRKRRLVPNTRSSRLSPACWTMHAPAAIVRLNPGQSLGVKLIIQVPCYNEAATLGITLWNLPRKLAGVTSVEWLVIDDGSTDGTSRVAEQFGADYILKLPKHAGLAAAFRLGLQTCLELGADLIVNTDADNQYHAGDIPALIRPILQEEADMVIGTRSIFQNPYFSPLKKILQRLGSFVVRIVSKTNVPDTRSGFRAFSRRAAGQLNVFSRYTYTLEIIIQAGHEDMAIACVPVRTNPDLRPSRLIRSLPDDLLKSAITIVRSYARYRPFTFFLTLSLLALCPAVALSAKPLYRLYSENIPIGAGFLAAMLTSCASSLFLFATAFLADLVSARPRAPSAVTLSFQRQSILRRRWPLNDDPGAPVRPLETSNWVSVKNA